MMPRLDVNPRTMAQRQPLAEMLVDLIGAVSPDCKSGLRVTSVLLDLPVEIRLLQSGDEFILLADLPRWRWATDFDEVRSRINLECREGDFQ